MASTTFAEVFTQAQVRAADGEQALLDRAARRIARAGLADRVTIQRVDLVSVRAATLVGVIPSTWRNYVATKRAPAPDGRLGGTNWWHRETVEGWMKQRPG
ncbi:MAG: hypothetical protein ACR2FF_02590 [Mycobacteriales bacterium]|nr:MAG: hypothetical protein DLM56_05575 [Pseudonocardiales bacterium]